MSQLKSRPAKVLAQSRWCPAFPLHSLPSDFLWFVAQYVLLLLQVSSLEISQSNLQVSSLYRPGWQVCTVYIVLNCYIRYKLVEGREAAIPPLSIGVTGFHALMLHKNKYVLSHSKVIKSRGRSIPQVIIIKFCRDQTIHVFFALCGIRFWVLTLIH